MLLRLVASTFAPSEALIVSLRERAGLAEEFEDIGVRVVCLDIPPGVPSLPDLLRLRRAVHQYRPDVIQGWMYHGNLAAVAAQRLWGWRAPLLWSIRTAVLPG